MPAPARRSRGRPPTTPRRAPVDAARRARRADADPRTTGAVAVRGRPARRGVGQARRSVADSVWGRRRPGGPGQRVTADQWRIRPVLSSPGAGDGLARSTRGAGDRAAAVPSRSHARRAPDRWGRPRRGRRRARARCRSRRRRRFAVHAGSQATRQRRIGPCRLAGRSHGCRRLDPPTVTARAVLGTAGSWLPRSSVTTGGPSRTREPTGPRRMVRDWPGPAPASQPRRARPLRTGRGQAASTALPLAPASRWTVLGALAGTTRRGHRHGPGAGHGLPAPGVRDHRRAAAGLRHCRARRSVGGAPVARPPLSVARPRWPGPVTACGR